MVNDPLLFSKYAFKWISYLGENLKALEVAEEKAQQREEEYKKQV